MSTSMEDLVRAAQEKQANLTPDPQRVLAAFPRRHTQLVRRRRLTVAVVAAAAVTAVLAVPVASLTDRGAGPVPQPAIKPTVSVPLPPAHVALRFQPGWLPDGYTEFYRNNRLGGTSRVWTPDDLTVPLAKNRRFVFLNVDPLRSLDGENGEQVDIAGSRGVYVPEANQVTWLSGGYTLAVGTINLALPKSTLLRIARSLRADEEVFPIPFRTPELSAGLEVVGWTVDGAGPQNWVGTVELGKNPGEPSGQVSISVGTATSAPQGGSERLVGGRPARLVKTSTGTSYLVVTLGGGRLLTVRSSVLPEVQLSRLAEGVGSPAAGKLSWIGSR
jgi:hypothetical protein